MNLHHDSKMTDFEIVMKLNDLERRLEEMETMSKELKPDVLQKRVIDLEDDLRNLKPLIYDVIRAAGTMKIEVDRISGFFSDMRKWIIGGVVSGIIGLLFFIITSLIEI